MNKKKFIDKENELKKKISSFSYYQKSLFSQIIVPLLLVAFLLKCSYYKLSVDNFAVEIYNLSLNFFFIAFLFLISFVINRFKINETGILIMLVFLIFLYIIVVDVHEELFIIINDIQKTDKTSDIYMLSGIIITISLSLLIITTCIHLYDIKCKIES